jgi:uncharacterized protein YuzE
MIVTYFKDTDTALLEFTSKPVAETRELNENVYIDLDAEGNLVAITIEHAKLNGSLPNVEVREVEQGAA